MRRYLTKDGKPLREAKSNPHFKGNRDLIKWVIDRTARLQEANDRELRADHMMKLQNQFSELIEQLTLAKILLAKIAQWGRY
jgi:hypothetical protein